ncbi:MAG TPA: hypothetical protein VMB48_04490, partial [Steroidobacteraceae bacterium]|nr:hypothetical protein [Steroidobacteraceae bacterium]
EPGNEGFATQSLAYDGRSHPDGGLGTNPNCHSNGNGEHKYRSEPDRSAPHGFRQRPIESARGISRRSLAFSAHQESK